MVHRFASESGLAYFVGDSSDVYMRFFSSEPIRADDPGLLVCLGCCNGRVIEAWGLFQISEMSSAEVIERCNRWNRERRWPTLALEGTAASGGREIVRASMAYPAATGTTQDIVVHVCSPIRGSMRQSWDWFRQESIDRQFAVLARQIMGHRPADHGAPTGRSSRGPVGSAAQTPGWTALIGCHPRAQCPPSGDVSLDSGRTGWNGASE